MNLDPVRFTASLVAKVKGALAPIEARLSALEQRQPLNGKDGRDGTDATVDLDALARKAAELIPTPKDGARGEKGEAGIDGLIGPIGPIGPVGPQGRDGKDAVVDLDALAIKAAELIPTPKDGAKGDRGEAGERGADATVDLDALALKAAELIPTPKDGTNGQDGARGEPGINGKDADPVTPALVLEALSASPDLLQKAVDLHLKAHPPAAGKDGADGLNGKDGADGREGLEGKPGRDGRDGTVGMPGRDGEKGQDGLDGRDGLGFDDIDVQFDGERSFSFKFVKGTQEKTFGSFVLPSVIYRGVYKEGQVYQKGDAATFGGSLWIAQKDTKTKPGTHEDWKLAVKRGSDGKDAK